MEHYNWSPMTNEKIKWAGIDFDDTIASNSSFPDYIPGAPLPGAAESVRALSELGYKITIFTARPWSDYANIESYCKHYGIPVRRIICGKPLLRFMIDDKAVAFNGDWDKSITDALKL